MTKNKNQQRYDNGVMEAISDVDASGAQIKISVCKLNPKAREFLDPSSNPISVILSDRVTISHVPVPSLSTNKSAGSNALPAVTSNAQETSSNCSAGDSSADGLFTQL